MKTIPYLFTVVSLAILAGSVALLVLTYFELVHPSVFLNRGDELAPASAYWFLGSIVNLIGSAILFCAILFFRERETNPGEVSASLNTEPASRKPSILVVRPDTHLAKLLAPVLVLVVIYQIPFVVLFTIFRYQWDRNGFASIGSVAILLLASFFAIRVVGYRMAVGDLQIELDEAPESDPNHLTGRIVLNRQSNSRGGPLVLSLKLYEIRDRISQRVVSGLADNSEAVNSRELYWQIQYATQSPIENPFQSETQFPFEIAIPAWLPRPWSRPGVNGTFGMEWQIEVSGRFARTKVSTTFPIQDVPSQLKQPPDKRIKISFQELVHFLSKQSIRLHREDEPRTTTIVRDRPPLGYTMVISSISLLIALGCAMALLRRFDEFAVWILLGSIAMCGASLGHRYMYRVSVIQDWDVVQQWRFFGLSYRRIVSREEFASVSVEPVKIQHDDETPHVEFNVFLISSGSKEIRMHLARIRTRLVAKAFAKAIANELRLSVVYSMSDG